MSAAMLTCAVCRHEGWDVRMTGIDRGEVSDAPLIDVALPLHEHTKGPPVLDMVNVPERFIREPRCEDSLACLARRAESS
jgi:hypothetical protein